MTVDALKAATELTGIVLDNEEACPRLRDVARSDRQVVTVAIVITAVSKAVAYPRNSRPDNKRPQFSLGASLRREVETSRTIQASSLLTHPLHTITPSPGPPRRDVSDGHDPEPGWPAAGARPHGRRCSLRLSGESPGLGLGRTVSFTLEARCIRRLLVTAN